MAKQYGRIADSDFKYGGQVMREFNGHQDWYKYISVRVILEFNECCPEKSGQVMREFLGV